MKKINVKTILTSLFVYCSFSSFSQAKLGIFGGPQVTSAKYKIEGDAQPVETKYGAQFGATLKVPFENKLYFAPAMYYSLKGYKVTLNKPSYPPSPKALNNDTRIHTIETAALLQYDLSTRPSHFYIKSGFAFDVVVNGQEKFDTTHAGRVSRSMKFDFTEYGRITASANVHFGFEAANGLIIFAHYAHGLGSMNNADFGPRILHRVAGISLGYYFRRNPNVIDTRVINK